MYNTFFEDPCFTALALSYIKNFTVGKDVTLYISGFDLRLVLVVTALVLNYRIKYAMYSKIVMVNLQIKWRVMLK